MKRCKKHVGRSNTALNKSVKFAKLNAQSSNSLSIKAFVRHPGSLADLKAGLGKANDGTSLEGASRNLGQSKVCRVMSASMI